MKKIFSILLLLITMTTFGLAQSSTTTTVVPISAYVGGEYRFVTNSKIEANAPGWEGAVTFNIGPVFGLTADIDGIYAKGGSTYDYLFGPTVTFVRKPKFVLFADGLIGVAHSAKSNVSANNLTYAVGGGFDIPVNKNWSIGPAKLKYVGVTSGPYTSTFRYSGGLVFNF